MRSTLLEFLESRRLLAGLTIIAPTWDSGLGGYVLTNETNITTRLGGSSQVPEYTITIAPNMTGSGSTATPGPLAVQGIAHDSRTATLADSPDQQVVLTIDYQTVSQNPDYPLSQVAGLVANYLETTPVDGVLLASLPIHEIGVSRSSALMDELNKALGQAGIWVDQETYNDPHPVSSIGDPSNAVYDNVAFADDYWRTSGQPEYSIFYNGHAVDGAYNQEMPYVEADTAGYGSPHQAPSGYYNATIDLNSISEGIGPEHDDWWGNTAAQPPRDQTGFYYSSIIGGARPLSGVWAASGGTGARVATVQSGQQWPNVTDVSLSNGNTFASGASIGIRYLHQDRGDSSTVTFAIDTDQNPLNNNSAMTLGSASFSSSATPSADQLTASTSGLAPGTYWICARTTDSQGLVRYSYSQPITVKPALTLATAAWAGPATVTGTYTHLRAVAIGGVDPSAVTYTWTTVRQPPGSADPVFIDNGTTTAGTMRVIFAKAGGYHFRCTITDGDGSVLTTDVSLTVQQTASTLHVTPQNTRIHVHGTLKLQSELLDQFGIPMRIEPFVAPHYKLREGSGTIDAAGVYTAGKPGNVLIEAEEGHLIGKLRSVVI